MCLGHLKKKKNGREEYGKLNNANTNKRETSVTILDQTK